jgi:hypothetical protein
MTGLWTTDRDTLAKALWGLPHQTPDGLAKALIDTGAVRVLDPDDTDMVGKGGMAVYEAHLHRPHIPGSVLWCNALARAVIEALREP